MLTPGSVKEPGSVLEEVTNKMMAGVKVILSVLSLAHSITMMRTMMLYGTMEVQETGRALIMIHIQSKLKIKVWSLILQIPRLKRVILMTFLGMKTLLHLKALNLSQERMLIGKCRNQIFQKRISMGLNQQSQF